MRGRVYVEDLIAQFEQRIERHRPAHKGVERSAFRELARALVKRAGEHYLLGHEGGEWLSHVEELLLFMERRKSQQILVQLSTPRGAGQHRSTWVFTCMGDQPFIVDTTRVCFEQNGVHIESQINLILPVRRDTTGRLVAVGGEHSESLAESVALYEVSPLVSAKERTRIGGDLRTRLRQARAMVSDFAEMTDCLRRYSTRYAAISDGDSARSAELKESKAFVDWLRSDHFVLLGLREWTVGGRDTKLGLARFADYGHDLGRGFLQGYIQGRGKSAPVMLRKSSAESTIHRRGKIDQVLVRRFGGDGRPSGALLCEGLFTHKAIQARGSQIPLLRTKLAQLTAADELRAGTYNYKAMVNAFNSLPVEYLLAASVADIRRLVKRSLAAERTRRLDSHLSMGEDGRSAYLFVVMPRENFHEDLRVRIQRFAEEQLQANYSDGRALVSTYGVAILHFYFTSAKAFPKRAVESLEESVTALSASWHDRFRDVLVQSLPGERAMELYRKYHDAFSRRYQVSTEPEQVLVDCLHLEAVGAAAQMRFALYRDTEDREQASIKLRIYEGTNLHLSDVLPILDDFGLRVINAFTNHVELKDGVVLYMDSFRFVADGSEWLLEKEGEAAFLEALQSIFDGRMISDRLNRVLLPARLRWREVALLRSLQGYAKQLGNMVTPSSIWPTLARHPEIVRLTLAFFVAKFAPSRGGVLESSPSRAREQRAQQIKQHILERLDAVESFDEDRTLRLFLNLVDAMLRTSFYKYEDAHQPLAHKFDCSRVASMPEPKPWREIYVHHRELEGVHLRGGRIARGGLRWSDRLEDYRTEILGLMVTQMVKNVVIVPVGAKGGFVLRNVPMEPAERRRHADSRYEIFVGALLDLSDNVVRDKTVPPANVVCWDDPDPYFVVAADKGTAHLSDTANRISEARGFWLGDAFASGGSHGYDHKGLGITAKGAFVCLRHLLRELGIRASRDEFSVVGIGDMGGDVFGNGMLEHSTIKLVAAFNHRHIFLDPDPDPKASHRERRRLFQAKYGGWDAYDPKLISRGGGVYERSAKKITLSTAAQAALGCAEPSVSGSGLIRLILCAEVDVLYNGGIGTYVKASRESDRDAADPSNDAVRVDASQIRARVACEGGNLGFTQAARVEFASRGGKINTDFIDNAGGVNCSDHEVNLKILLQPLVATKQLSAGARNRLLGAVEADVTADVLAANAEQALLLSLDEIRSRENLAGFDDVIDEVCRRFSLKRSAVELPSVREIQRRMEAGDGLTRPELATLSSYVKMQLYEELVEDESLEFAGLLPALRNYFPERVRRRFPKAIEKHRLGREIALTRLTNRIIDHTGVTLFREMARDCDVTARQSFEAYSLASRALDAWAVRIEIADLGGKLAVEAKYQALLIIEQALRSASLYLIEQWPEEKMQKALRSTAPYAKRLRALETAFDQLLDARSRERVGQVSEELAASGLPKTLARRIAGFRYLPHLLAIQDLADRTRRPARKLCADYFAAGRASGIFRVLRQLEDLRSREYYEALALRAQRRDLEGLLRELVLKLSNKSGSVEQRLHALDPADSVFSELDQISPEDFGPAALLVCMERIRSILRKKD
jgi:glutamate dehydrogenase